MGEVSEQAQARKYDRRTFLKILGMSGAAAVGMTACGTETQSSLTPTRAESVVEQPISTPELSAEDIRNTILNFSWEQARNPEELKSFTEKMATAYLKLTATPRLTKEKLTGEGRTSLYPSRESFIQAVREVQPDYNPGDTQWGYADFTSEKVFIDVSSMESQARQAGHQLPAGASLVDGLWHEWGHLDVTPRTSGEFLNNPQVTFFSPTTQQEEVLTSYRGGAAYTDTYYGFLRFEEVLNETVTVRRLIEQVGLTELASARDYYPNGVDFFPKLTQKANIAVDELYNYHATSDFEGLAAKIGQILPGEAEPALKGSSLFVGIHQSDSYIIQQSGALELLNNN